MKKTNTSQNVIGHNINISEIDDNYILQRGIEKLTEESEAFQFLIDEEDIYTVEDIKEKY